MLQSQEIQRLLEPLGATSLSNGVTPPSLLNGEDLAEFSRLLDAIEADPILLTQLTNRVYQLMLSDVHLQHERSRGYGGY